MRKRLLLGLSLLAVAALTVMGSASAGSVPTKDKVSGDGQRAARVSNGPSPLFTIDSTSGPSGQNPTGTMTMDWGTAFGAPTNFTVKVTCLHVSGNQATILGVITSGTGIDGVYGDALAPGDEFLIAVQDNGVAQKGGVSPDRLSGVLWGTGFIEDPNVLNSTKAAVCADSTDALGTPDHYVGLVSGNINVTDAP